VTAVYVVSFEDDDDILAAAAAAASSVVLAGEISVVFDADESKE